MKLEDFADPDGECAVSITDALGGADETALFSQILSETGVGSILDDEGTGYTIFAPTDKVIL